MPEPTWSGPIEKVDDYRWKIPKTYKPCMRVDGLVYATERMISIIRKDQAMEQVANVACLPGIVGRSMAMPDIHWGYGFPIGGVAAMDVENGVISPGGVGYDINCGVRLLRTDLTEEEVRPRLQQLVTELFKNIPSGVGAEGKLRVSASELRQVMVKGSRWAVENGYGWPEDLEVTESNGQLEGAVPENVTPKAIERGRPQLGTLGAGNHFLEVQVVDEIYDPQAAEVMGIHQVGQVCVMIHCGSRGFGYQTCEDYLSIMNQALKKYGIEIPDRQLVCAPLKSEEAQRYFGAMCAAANYAWTNRQVIAHWTREAFAKVFGKSARDLGIYQVYDVAHNIAKIEDHKIDGKTRRVCVHRKGATRAFPPGSPFIPEKYRSIGQPVLVPGDMGRYSFLLVGTEKAMEETFGSTCHGAGRMLSRKASVRQHKNVDLVRELGERGIVIKAASRETVLEEAPVAYKDVEDVVTACHGAGISRKVARLRPIGVVKG